MSHNWFRWYHVESGDTLGGIALWWYGNGNEPYWRRIWLANRHVIGSDPDQIQQSMWLRLPFWGFWCHIEEGDTLFQLAEWLYGEGNAFWIIAQANPGIDPDNIFPSMWVWCP
jgi:nucleoid-associated protein YgaU